MMEINVTPDDVEKLVKDAILKAGIGKAIEKSLVEHLSGYKSPVDAAMKDAVAQVTRRLLNEEPWATRVREAVSAALTKLIESNVLTETANKTVDKMMRAADDRF